MRYLSLLIAGASAMIRDPLRQGRYGLLAESDNGNFTESTFDTKLDHFADETSTFKLRYWENKQFFDQEKGPIFLYVCGEWRCAPPAVDQAAYQLGQELGAKLLALEHRYYGESQPFTDAQGGFSYDNLKYLNTTQALHDIHGFIQAQLKEEENTDRQVVIIGGSYPGALVAWYQNVFNDASAVWSSSGVVEAIENFEGFDSVISKMTQESHDEKRHADCRKVIDDFTIYVDKALQCPEVRGDMFKTFGLAENATVNSFDFMFYIADIFTMYVQYGSRTQLCDVLLSENYTADPMTTVAKLGSDRGVAFSDYDAEALSKTKVDTYSPARQWTYQYCSMFGWFQVPSSKVSPTRSATLNESNWLDYCRRIYSDDMPEPDVKYALNALGNKKMTHGHNVVYFNAREDPWQAAGILEVSAEQKARNMEAFYVDCVDCGHCTDLHAASADEPKIQKELREKAQATIKKWLLEEQQSKAVDFFLQA